MQYVKKYFKNILYILYLFVILFYNIELCAIDIQGSCAKKADQYDREIIEIACKYYNREISDNMKVLLLDVILLKNCGDQEMEINIGRRISLKFDEVLNKKIPCN